jgi:hypothetical protein
MALSASVRLRRAVRKFEHVCPTGWKQAMECALEINRAVDMQHTEHSV